MSESLKISDLDVFSSKDARNNIRSFKKVTFNTASTSDYATNEAYKTLRTNIMFCGAEIKSIVITSCNENEGKSTVSTELSKSFAEIGKHTLLIDADMRKSVMLKKNMHSSEIVGLSEVLSGQIDINDAIYNTQSPDFDVVFAGRFPPNPVELIGGGRFEKLVNDLKLKYDYIIIDTPPLGAVIDAAVISSVCDGSVIVIADRRVDKNAAIQVKEQLEKSGCKILGAVINETDRKYSKYYKKYYKYSDE